MSLVLVAGCASTLPSPPCQYTQIAHCEWQPVTGPGRIQLQVREAKTKQPCFNANVQVPGAIIGASSDFGGVATIDSVPAGEYELLVRFGGFEDCYLTGVVVREGFLTDVGTVQLCKRRIEFSPVITW